MNEIWKDIPGYEGLYQVSDLGNVRSLNYGGWGKCQLFKLGSLKKYLKVTLRLKGKNKGFYVHQLVAIAFLGHKPNGNKAEVDHIDHNKHNNRLDNLRIVTSRENNHHGLLTRKKSGLPLGVNPNGKGYSATIRINGIRKDLGYFKTPEEASTAYQQELNKL